MAASSSRSRTGDPPLAPEPPSDLAGRVTEAELARLLGYPDGRIPPGLPAAAAAAARDWYQRHGRARVLARRVPIDEIHDEEIRLTDGEVLTSRVLAARLRRGEATAIAVAAVSAGHEVDEQSVESWRLGRPDEGYFLDRFAAAVVELLAAWTADRLRADLESSGLGLLPSYSPGYRGWDLEQQTRVAGCLGADAALAAAGFEVLDSGMIRPKSSLLAVFGVTPRLDLARTAWRRDRCSWCALTSCGFRRVRAGRGDGG